LKAHPTVQVALVNRPDMPVIDLQALREMLANIELPPKAYLNQN
jgi:hypothetical protein